MGALDGRVALVTGSTRGIGRGIAELFAAEGAKVVVNGRRQADADETAAAIPGSVGIGADQSDLGQVRELCRRSAEAFGTVDILVNNAAIAPRTAITRVTDEEWMETLLVDLTGPFWMMREIIPGMKSLGHGSILNITSGAGISGTPGFASYSAAKGGLNGISYTAALELARFGIRVNLLAAGALTDMLRQLPPELLDPMKESMPTIEANARTALHLVATDGVTGQCFRPGQELEA
jgi:3-oxoacyl-[acyl-carrier protein] reductase